MNTALGPFALFPVPIAMAFAPFAAFPAAGSPQINEVSPPVPSTQSCGSPGAANAGAANRLRTAAAIRFRCRTGTAAIPARAGFFDIAKIPRLNGLPLQSFTKGNVDETGRCTRNLVRIFYRLCNDRSEDRRVGK